MMGRTHAVIATATAVPLAIAFEEPVMLVVGLVAGLVPDLDANDSTLKHWHITTGSGPSRLQIKPFYPLALLTALIFRHRGFLHSLPAALMFSAIFGVFTNWTLATAAFFGYASHLFLDGCTKSGIPLFLGRRWHFLPKFLLIRTDSYVEHLVLALGAVVVIAYAVPLITNGPLYYGL